MLYQRSSALFEEAYKYIPGGVNSPVRAFKSVGGVPIFMKSAKGAYLTDEDDRTYIDYINSWGPAILGHTHPEVLEALKLQERKDFLLERQRNWKRRLQNSLWKMFRMLTKSGWFLRAPKLV